MCKPILVSYQSYLGGGVGDGYVERVRMGARVYTDIRVCITRIVSPG